MIIRVHTPAHANAALAAAREAGRPVRLLSSPGAPAAQGRRWLRRVAAEAARAYAGVDWQVIVDCADAPGHALACLEDGASAVAVRALPDAAVARLEAIAAGLGAEVLVAPRPDLDLLDHAEPLAACRDLFGR